MDDFRGATGGARQRRRLQRRARADAFSATGNLLYAFGNDGTDQLYLRRQRFQLSGGNHDDTLRADGAGNDLYGDGGNDLLPVVFSDSNRLFGGAGNDTYIVGRGSRLECPCSVLAGTSTRKSTSFRRACRARSERQFASRRSGLRRGTRPA